MTAESWPALRCSQFVAASTMQAGAVRRPRLAHGGVVLLLERLVGRAPAEPLGVVERGHAELAARLGADVVAPLRAAGAGPVVGVEEPVGRGGAGHARP